MALTNDKALAERMTLLRSHGITRDPANMLCREAPNSTGALSRGVPAWYYEQQMLGYNYRMTDIAAALGTSQLQRIDDYVERRNVLARRYDRALSSLPLLLPSPQAANRSAYHLYVARLRPEATRATHRSVFEGMRERGIGVNLHYMPVHLQPYYRDLGFSLGQFPESEAHGNSALSLPIFPGLSLAKQDEVVAALEDIFCELR